MPSVHLDIRTLSLVTVLFSFVYGIGLFCVSRMQRSAIGIKTFASGLLATGSGFLLMGFRGSIPAWGSVVAANFMIFLGFVMVCQGLIRFRNNRTKLLLPSLILLAAVLILFIANTYYYPSIALRTMWICLAISIQSTICVLGITRSAIDEAPLAKWMTIAPLILIIGFFSFRALWALKEESMRSFMNAGTVHQLAFLVYILMVITTSFGLMWMLSSRLEQRLRDKARIDSLTRTLNRRALSEIHPREIARAKRHDLPLSIIMADIDHFKQVNDTYGHQVGDMVLSGFATMLMDNVRSQDVVVRYGGEEFLILLPDTTEAQAQIVAEKLRMRSASEHLNHDHGITCTTSFGIAQLKRDDTWESLTSRADSALYAAKDAGRNRVIMASSQHQE